jgi:hypothetical protein
MARGQARQKESLASTIPPCKSHKQKEPDVKKIIRVLIASLLLAGSLSVYSLADGGGPTPCNPDTKICK